jgi:hypothetical protein
MGAPGSVANVMGIHPPESTMVRSLLLAAAAAVLATGCSTLAHQGHEARDAQPKMHEQCPMHQQHMQAQAAASAPAAGAHPCPMMKKS